MTDPRAGERGNAGRRSLRSGARRADPGYDRAAASQTVETGGRRCLP